MKPGCDKRGTGLAKRRPCLRSHCTCMINWWRCCCSTAFVILGSARIAPGVAAPMDMLGAHCFLHYASSGALRFVPSTLLLRVSTNAAGRALPKNVTQASDNHYIFQFYNRLHISSDESGMVRKPSSNAWFGETFAIECNWGGLCVFTLDQCCRKSHWKSLVGESDLGVIAWCITASLHISDFSSCMCLCHLYSSYPTLFPACFCCTVVLWLQSDTCLDPMSNADASGNARGAETSDRPTLGGTADPLGNPIVGGNPNPSGSGDGNNDTKVPLCPLPSSMRNELFQDLFCFCVTLLRAFSFAAELRPCATRTDSSERAEREVQEATRVMEDRELYRTFLVLKEGLTSDPEKRREIEKTTRTKGRDRSRSRQRWFGHVNERATMVIHRNCHSSILWPFGVFLNVQLELCPDLYVSEKGFMSSALITFISRRVFFCFSFTILQWNRTSLIVPSLFWYIAEGFGIAIPNAFTKLAGHFLGEGFLLGPEPAWS